MKQNNQFAKGIFRFFLAGILTTFIFNTSNAQCVSALNHSFVVSSDVLAPSQCTYTVNVCITVNDSALNFLSFSISTGSNTDNEVVPGPFTNGQVVCQDLDIIIANCDESTLVNIDVAGSDTACTIANFDGPLNAFGNGGGALAVEFAYFEGYQSKNEIVIEWITETESSNDYFEIEHGNDGRTFKYVEKIDGAGTSLDANVYKYVHRFPTNGLNYYRLKMVEFDGTITYSKVITLEIESEVIINIFPTTVDTELNVKLFEAVDENTTISIFSSTGKNIANYQIGVGDNSLQIPTANLIAGIYYIKIKLQGEGVVTKPFIKKTK